MKTNPITSWLIGADTPSIRYAAMKDLMDLPETNRQAAQARREIRTLGPAPAILSRQTAAGNWKIDRSYYTPKFFSTHWSMLLLSELRADGRDPRYRRGARFMLGATAEGLNRGSREHSTGWSCFYGNMLRYVLRAERVDDPRVKVLIRWLTDSLRNGECACDHNGGKPCAWGVVRSLYGLAAIPKSRRAQEVRSAISRGIAFLTEDGRLLPSEYPTPGNRPPNSLWSKLNFPLFYQADLLLTLRVLGELDALQRPGVQPALDWLERSRHREGRWRGSSPYRQRTWKELGGREETDRWVSLQVATILRRAGRSAAIEPAG
jgi:hypothetical protein